MDLKGWGGKEGEKKKWRGSATRGDATLVLLESLQTGRSGTILNHRFLVSPECAMYLKRRSQRESVNKIIPDKKRHEINGSEQGSDSKKSL